MEQRRHETRRARKKWTTITMLLVAFWSSVSAQFRYSVLEEVPEGTVVGNIAKDLGLDKTTLKERGIRIVYGSTEPPFIVKQDDGVLYVKGKIDREEICERRKVCVIDLKTVLQNPLEIHHVVVEILDVNDYSPVFPQKENILEVSESALPGAKFQLQAARDADSGLLSVQQYRLSQNGHFRLDVKDRGEDRKTPSLVLEKPLDRESIKNHVLLLTALDGGKPPRSGNMTIIVNVSDVNDNPPVFSQESYTVSLKENSPVGTTVIQVNATDLDEGPNGEVEYSFGNDVDARIRESFSLNPLTGVIVVAGAIDFEENSRYEIDIQASDKDSGSPSLSSNVTVNVFILDQNDNAPVILYPVSSNGSAEGVEEIPRNVNAGHSVTKVRAYDADIGYNGWLLFSLQEVTDHSLFGLDRYTGQIRTLRSFTETDEAEHKLVILVKDNGNVSLSATATVIVKLVEPKEAFAASDVKSAAKDDEDNNVTFYLMITLGSVSVLFIISIIVLIAMQCSKSTDYTSKYLPETNYDGTLCHSIQYRSGDKRYMLVGPRMSIGSAIVPGSHANTLVLPDRRRTCEEFQVVASDSGSPSLSSNVTVNVFILDQNDNAPVILYPVSSNGSAEGVEEIPRNVNAGHLVTKVRAYDADIGYNGWLLFSLQEVTDHSLFGLDRYTGQIRTLRSFTETDEAEHKLVILVKDNGNVSLSATATVIVKLVEPKEAFAASDVKSAAKDDEDNNVTFYLMITLGSVSVLFIISIIVLSAMQCSKSTDYTSKYLPETNYDGTLCHSIQYRSGDKRYMLVGPRMSIGSTIVPGSHANTLVLPDRRRTCEEFWSVLWIADILGLTMGQRKRTVGRLRRYLFGCFYAVILWSLASAQLRYSISEEISEGAVVGNIAKDLGLDKSTLRDRKYRIVSSDADPLFRVNQNDGILYVSRKIDREEVCSDSSTCLINLKTVLENPLEVHYVRVEVLDINDHSPSFQDNETTLEISESVLPGTRFQLKAAKDQDSGYFSVQQYKLSQNDNFRLEVKDKRNDIKLPILIVQKPLDRETAGTHSLTLTALDGALDRDENENALISYHVTGEGSKDSMLISFLNINSETGEIAALKSFDFETVKTFQFQVVASDSGSPSLSSNVTVNVFILDQNDNAPVILYPVSSNGSAEGVEEIPRNVNAGHLVTKVRAYDADIGYNGWLLFSLQEVTDHSLFGLDRYTGQIRTLRSFTETDEAEHKLVILVKDNGNVSLSATATVIVKLVEPKEAFAASDVKSAAKDDEDNNVTFYLMITLGSVSVLFIISIIVLIAMQCSKSTDYTSKYLPETNYDGTLCHSIQYRSGDKRYMLVGPRMSIGSTIVPGSHANTLVLPDRRRTCEEFWSVLWIADILGLTMGQRKRTVGRLRRYLFGCFYAVILWSLASAQLRYSISEEISEGAVVGNIAKDLGLDKSTLRDRKYRIVSSDADPLFRVNQNDGILYVSRKIDREEVCSDSSTCLINLKTVLENPLEVHYVRVEVLDINDHSPSFQDNETTLEISESVLPGTRFQLKAAKDQDSGYFSVQQYKLSQNDNFRLEVKDKRNDIKLPILIVQKPLDRETAGTHSLTLTALDGALDRDENENALISYHVTGEGSKDSMLISFLNINSETGEIAALKSFDFETVKTFQFQVVASDSGSPSLSSNVTVNVFILDQNDNAPVILYPVSSNGSAEGVEEIPRNVNAGHLVTKVRAYDADIGYNGWLLFSLQEVTDHSLFGLDRYTGQIRTLRSFTETDEAEHKLVILVKDNGNVSLSATATVIVKLVEPKEAFAASDVKSAAKDDEDNNVTFYLMITLGSVSVLFIISIIVLIAMQCSKSTDYTSKYLPETNYDGTLCHSIQYRSGDKRYMLVGPRMSIGSTIVPGSHANTLVLPDRRRTCEEFWSVLWIADILGLTMGQRKRTVGRLRRYLFGCFYAVILWSLASAQLRYSISEEISEGAVVGNIAKDLGLDKSTLRDRKYRIVSSDADPLFRVNQNDGILYVSRKIDREEVCSDSSTCLINLKTVLENPLEVHYVRVEVLDINDHSPSFQDNETTLEISESVLPGTRFQLKAAKDQDSGYFSVQQYKLSQNDNFRLEVKDKRNDIKLPILIVQKPLDRETAGTHSLTLTALDGDSGSSSLSSNVTVNVFILDQNDNAPVILYPVSSNGSAEGVEEIPRENVKRRTLGD
ncbi:hypothetical protein CRENBAI_017669 [Crenichthys baileyi]|uniref:Cadherin domain-containing protein n=1 Tax=Crenichthys baileyi TaxID=28760 RepID=A0AAV9RJC0_9TELE